MKVVASQKKEGVFIIPKCPGCGAIHFINTSAANEGPIWGFNGDLENPTFTPSLRAATGKYVPGLSKTQYDYYNATEDEWPSTLCHSFIRNGTIEFLSDCSHPLAGHSVELPAIDTN